jgi:hypothetical protein
MNSAKGEIRVSESDTWLAKMEKFSRKAKPGLVIKIQAKMI